MPSFRPAFRPRPISHRRALAPAALALALYAVFPNTRAAVANPNTCASGTLYSSTDPNAYSGFTTAANPAQMDCTHNLAIGGGTQAGTDTTHQNVAVGGFATAQGGNSVAVGVGSGATAGNSTAIGSGAQASGSNSVSLGSGSTDGGQTDVVSLGNGTTNRSLINVSDIRSTGSISTTGTIKSNGYITTTSFIQGSSVYASNILQGGWITDGTASLSGGDFNTAGTVQAGTLSDGTATLSGGNFTTNGSLTAGQLRLSGSASVNGTLDARYVTAGTVTGGALTDGTAMLSGGNLSTIGTVSAGRIEASGGASIQGGLDNGGGGITRAGRINGVTAGAVDAVSSDAVNGSQLYAATQATSAAQATADTALSQSQQNTVQIQAMVNGQLGVCTVSNGALQCSVSGQAAARAQGIGATAVGIAANAQGAGAQAIGRGTNASGDGTLALGDGAQAAQAGSVAIGQGARATGDPTVAVGANAQALGANAVALGANTIAGGIDSVALGQGSVADRNGTVSVGDATAGLTRQIANVAPGVMPNDAVNVAQLQQGLQGGYDRARGYAAAAVAQAAALNQTPVFGPSGNALTAGMGSYDGRSALGVQYHHRFAASASHPTYLSLGVAAGSDNAPVLFHAGVGIGW